VRQCRALRRAGLRMHDRSVGLQNTGLQPLTNQSQEGPVVDALLEHLQQPVVVEIIEEALDVGLHDIPIDPVLQVEGELPHRIQCATVWSVSIAACEEVLLVDGHEQLGTGELHQLVLQRRDT
jgi:hypothetical protein